jgi:glucose/arabinose dehydrogenase/cytochrome c553
MPVPRRTALPRPLALVSLLALAALLPPTATAATPKAAKKAPPPKVAASSAPWVEADFPFFSSILDARAAGAGLPTDNLAPRGLVLNLGGGLWAGFDPDLLRLVALWRGEGVTAAALAPGSYHDIGRKTPGGQEKLPQLAGTAWLATGVHPGWQAAGPLDRTDPRTPAPSPEEPGRGPLPPERGRFRAVQLLPDGAVLEYEVAGATVRERFFPAGTAAEPGIGRTVEVGPGPALRLLAGRTAAGVALRLAAPAVPGGAALSFEQGMHVVDLPARTAPLRFTVLAGPGPAATTLAGEPPALTGRNRARWPEELPTTVKMAEATTAFVIDPIGLPDPNPRRRAVRPSDIQFLPDGTAAVVTLDGDVWLVRGLHEPAGQPRWRRFASGLHEPMSLAVRGDELMAFDRNGIWRLRDLDGDGEADVHELFSNAFGQTADLREFPSQIRPAPGGEFVIAKGGQQATTQGKHNGSVLRISADGRTATVLGYGFRQPNIGVDPRTGLVTSSDQQGQYIPSTPLHVVRDGRFHGFLPPFTPIEQYPAPVVEPLTWIPHPVNASALSQVWLHDARLGPLNGSLVHIGYNRPELFQVLFNRRGTEPQAAVVSITRGFAFPPLNGAVNPRDGLLYLAGFQVLGWGNVIDVPAGLGRLRHTGRPDPLPLELAVLDRGVLLRFGSPLDPRRATDPASYSLQGWSYRRTHKYGSAQYKADGSPGQDAFTPSAAYLSRDGRSVFVAVPGLQPVMQLRVGWSLATVTGERLEENAYTTPRELTPFDPEREGFGPLTIDLTPRVAATVAAGIASAEEGARLAQLFACTACHGAGQDLAVARSGPPWQGLYGSERTVYVGGKAVKLRIDEAYLRESILDPTAKLAGGFEKGEYAMASFAGVLSDTQVESLILHIKTLR